MPDAYTPTPRTRVTRIPDRARYDRALVHSILDAGCICHVGFVADGQPFVIPTAYVRVGDQIYFHGSAASRMLRSLADGLDVCVTVTLLDGFVLARSAFHHSLNYRSVVALGRARLVTDADERIEALRRFTDHLVAQRWAEVRTPNVQELKATAVMALPLDEVSAKIRTGPPKDDEEDYALPVWAGVVPVTTVAGEPMPDTRLTPGVKPFDRSRVRT